MVYPKNTHITNDDPAKKYFVQTCKKYLKILNIDMSFEKIEKMSKTGWKKLIKEKTRLEAFKFLESEKSKQSKICEISYKRLEMQEYLLLGDRNPKVSKVVFKARSKTLDVKVQRKWKYDDLYCSGCFQNEESPDEIINCEKFGENKKKVKYSWFFSDSADTQISAAKVMMEKLKIRKELREKIS